jgi:DNA-directed RNA polymerase subunit alpha
MDISNVIEAVSIKTVSETDRLGVFEIEGLYRGYGLTLGAAIRRVLLSSLPGAAITQVKIKGVGHEFTTIPGVLEDVVEISLNLKKIRFRMHTSEPQVLTLKVKKEGLVTAASIKGNSDVMVVSPELPIATITDKSTELDIELTVEKGLGYLPVESQKREKLPIGVIELDAIFSPIVKVNFSTEAMRVGDRTDYNRSRLTIETDGTLTPSHALHEASKLLQSLFGKVSEVKVEATTMKAVEAEAETDENPEEKKAAKAKKASKKKAA